MTTAEALINYANVYRSFIDGKVSNVDVAVQYATQDIFNSVKHLSEKLAVEVINDDALYLQEKT